MQVRVIVEKHPDGYVAYPLGVKGVIVGQGDSYQAALEDVRSAISLHMEIFGPNTFVDEESPDYLRSNDHSLAPTGIWVD